MSPLFVLVLGLAALGCMLAALAGWAKYLRNLGRFRAAFASQEQNAAKKKNIEKQCGELQAQVQELLPVREALASERQRSEQLEQALGEERERAKPTAARIAELEQDLTRHREILESDEKLGGLLKRLEEVERENRELAGRVEGAQGELQQAWERVSTAAEAQACAERTLSEVQAEASQLRQALKESQSTYEAACQERDSIQAQLEHSRKFLIDEKGRAELLSQRAESLAAALVAEQKKLRAAEKALSEQKSVFMGREKESETLRKDLGRARQAITEAESAMKAKEKELSELRTEAPEKWDAIALIVGDAGRGKTVWTDNLVSDRYVGMKSPGATERVRVVKAQKKEFRFISPGDGKTIHLTLREFLDAGGEYPGEVARALRDARTRGASRLVVFPAVAAEGDQNGSFETDLGFQLGYIRSIEAIREEVEAFSHCAVVPLLLKADAAQTALPELVHRVKEVMSSWRIRPLLDPIESSFANEDRYGYSVDRVGSALRQVVEVWRSNGIVPKAR